MRREKPIAIILVVFAIVFVVIGIMYITILLKNLPGFMPGHVEKKTVTTKTTHTTVSGLTATTKAPGTAKAKPPAKKTAKKYYWQACRRLVLRGRGAARDRLDDLEHPTTTSTPSLSRAVRPRH